MATLSADGASWPNAIPLGTIPMTSSVNATHNRLCRTHLLRIVAMPVRRLLESNALVVPGARGDSRGFVTPVFPAGLRRVKVTQPGTTATATNSTTASGSNSSLIPIRAIGG